MMTKIDNVHLHSSDLHAFEDAEQARTAFKVSRGQP